MGMASQGVDQIWEIGAGKALSGMVRRIDRAIDCEAIGTAADAAAAAQA
jgi:[acyl-carrier-protein] S-malonyltransferase